MENKKYLTAEDIITFVLDLAHSQGFYSRLFIDWEMLKEEYPEDYEDLKQRLNDLHCETKLDFIRYYEEGVIPQNAVFSLDDILTDHVISYDRADDGGEIYIYKDLAYLTYDALLAQIHKDYNIKKEENN